MHCAILCLNTVFGCCWPLTITSYITHPCTEISCLLETRHDQATIISSLLLKIIVSLMALNKFTRFLTYVATFGFEEHNFV